MPTTNSFSPRPFRALFVLFGSNLLRRRQAWFGIFLSPIINVTLFFFVFSNSNAVAITPSFFASYLLPGGMGPTLTSLGIQLAGWKRTSMLKRIGANVRVWQLMMSTVVVHVLAGIVAMLWLLGIMLVLINVQPPPNLHFSDLIASARHWWWIIIAAVFTLAIGCVFSLLMVGWFKNTHSAEGVIIMTFFLTLMLGGVMFPVNILDRNATLFVISLLLPFKFCIYMANAGFGYVPQNANSHWWNHASTAFITRPWISLVGALVLLAVLLALLLRYFRWEARV